MRICSLLPSATEILYALGLDDSIAGVTFECDYPPAARTRPILVQSALAHNATPAEIDTQVTEYAAHGDSIYRIDTALLNAIEPDVIVTQELCDVCAVSTSHLAKALDGLAIRPEIVSLTPHRLEDVFADILAVGRAADCEQRACDLVGSLRARVERVRARPKLHAPTVVCVEWLAPPFNAGHWVPEMVEIAGGTELLGASGRDSTRMDWEQLRAADPEVLLIMPCGYDAATAAAEYHAAELPAWWAGLSAVRGGRVYALNANAFFSRPGPRLVEGIETLSVLLQSDSIALPEAAFIAL